MFPAVHNHMSDIDSSGSNWRKESNFEPRSLSDWTEKTFVVKYHSGFAFKNDSTSTIQMHLSYNMIRQSFTLLHWGRPLFLKITTISARMPTIHINK